MKKEERKNHSYKKLNQKQLWSFIAVSKVMTGFFEKTKKNNVLSAA